MTSADQDLDDLLLRRAAAERDLTSYPGVFSVGLGLRERGGRLTDEIALRVYVLAKKPAAELGPHEMVPREHSGLPTDVLVVPDTVPATTRSACENHGYESPLIGGATLTALHPDDQGRMEFGTLGFFATLTGETPPYNIGAITNEHVALAPGVRLRDTVYQPVWTQSGSHWAFSSADKSRVVGTILRSFKGPYEYTYPGAAKDLYYVDGAVVKLDIHISSCCSCNCGVSFKNEVRGLGATLTLPGGGMQTSNALASVGRAVMGMDVIKVGAETERTEGKISDIALSLPGTDLKNAIEITASGPDCSGIQRFSFTGDSGSAIVTKQGGILVGLLFSAHPTDTAKALACHVHPLLASLKATAITTASPVHDNPASQGLVAGGQPNPVAALRQRFTASAEGRRIAALVDRHGPEVAHLVNHNRRVTVSWHRGRGPAFLAHAMINARDPARRIPRTIDGVDRDALLAAMARVLAEQGSPDLAAALAEHGDRVRGHLGRFDDLHKLAAHLAAAEDAHARPSP